MIMLALAAVLPAGAQSRGNRLCLEAGAFTGNGLGTTLFYERETRHHNAFEVSLDGYLEYADCQSCGHVCPESFWKEYNTFMCGVAWKPCVLLRKNTWGSLKIGTGIGTDRDDLIGAIQLGYERNYALRRDCIFFWQVRSDFMFGARRLLRPGLEIGFKIPIYTNAL